jgi:hypothetical protein
MAIIDSLINSAIKFLQKNQKSRKRKKKRQKAAARKTKSRKKKILKPSGASHILVRRKLRHRSKPKGKSGKAARKKKRPLSKVKKKVVVKAKKKVSNHKPNNIKTAHVRGGVKLQGILVGEITHFFSRIEVVVIKMTKGNLRIGDQIQIKGRATDFIQKVDSLQIESVDVKVARKGQLVGLKVVKKVKAGDKIYKLP